MEMPEIQGVERGATSAAGTGHVQGIIDGPAGEVLSDGKLNGFMIFRLCERD